MKILNRKKLNIRKAARFAIAINAAQVVAIVAVIAYVLLTGGGRYVELGALLAALVLIAWGAALDIREALNAERIAEQAAALEDAYAQLEELNGSLRKQRHDFTNHLQVIFSLMEMEAFDDAAQYVESVYGDIRRTGSALKTGIPAVNALIAAKRADCEAHGIHFTTDIGSDWRGLPVPGWEMCRVLGNLIDNARDALMEAPPEGGGQIALRIDETPSAYTFQVSNNGPAIPEAHLPELFKLGFTTKADGHGSGLSIVLEVLEAYGGGIDVVSTRELTRFSGSVPRSPAPLSPRADA